LLSYTRKKRALNSRGPKELWTNYTLRKKLQVAGKNYVIRSCIVHLSRTVIKKTKSRNVILLGYVANMGHIKYLHKRLVGLPEGKNNLVN